MRYHEYEMDEAEIEETMDCLPPLDIGSLQKRLESAQEYLQKNKAKLLKTGIADSSISAEIGNLYYDADFLSLEERRNIGNLRARLFELKLKVLSVAIESFKTYPDSSCLTGGFRSMKQLGFTKEMVDEYLTWDRVYYSQNIRRSSIRDVKMLPGGLSDLFTFSYGYDGAICSTEIKAIRALCLSKQFYNGKKDDPQEFLKKLSDEEKLKLRRNLLLWKTGSTDDIIIDDGVHHADDELKSGINFVLETLPATSEGYKSRYKIRFRSGIVSELHSIGFAHSPSYRLVSIMGEVFGLTGPQAEVIAILHRYGLDNSKEAWMPAIDIAAMLNEKRMGAVEKGRKKHTKKIEALETFRVIDKFRETAVKGKREQKPIYHRLIEEKKVGSLKCHRLRLNQK